MSTPAAEKCLDPRRVDVAERRRSRVVVAAVLRAVGEHRAIRANRAGDEQVGRRDARLFGEPVARPAGELDAAADRVEGRRAIEAGRLETRDGRLVAGSRRDLCPGRK